MEGAEAVYPGVQAAGQWALGRPVMPGLQDGPETPEEEAEEAGAGELRRHPG